MITWTHPVAWGVYVYGVLSLLTAGLLWWLRYSVLVPQKELLSQDLNDIQMQIQDARVQLKALNRQVDRGLEQLEDLLNLVQTLFIGLLETRLMGLILKKLKYQPLVLRFAIKQGLSQVFTRVLDIIKNKRITYDDEAAS